MIEQAKAKRAWLPWAAGAIACALLLAAVAWLIGKNSATRPQPKYTRLTYQLGYPTNARFAKDGQTVVYSAQWNNDAVQTYTVREEFPQSTKVDLPSATLLAVSPSGDIELALDPVFNSNFLSGTMAQAPMAGGTPREQEKGVIAADYAPDGKTLAMVRFANRKVQLEYPAGKVIYTTSGYLDYVRVSPSGKEVAFMEHTVYGDDRGWAAFIDEGGNHKQLTKEFATAQGLAWSPSGKEIWFTASGDGTNRHLYAVNLSGKMRTVLATPQATRLLDIAADGRVLLSSDEFRAEIVGIDPATGKERRGLEWFNGSIVSDILPNGKAILFLEWGGPAGELYLAGYRKMDGSAPVSLGPGGNPKFSPDGTLAAAPLLTRPPQVALHPIGAGASRLLPLGDLVTVGTTLGWFPDGKHLVFTAATEGQPLRTYIVDLQGGKPQPVGPADFRGISVAGDGKRIAGRNAAGDAVLFNLEAQNLQPISGIEPNDAIHKWSKDDAALMVTDATPAQARVFRVEVATGKRTLLQKVELNERAGSSELIRLWYAEDSKTYVYNTRRVLGSLYVVEGLE